jgi:hypothetical protein
MVDSMSVISYARCFPEIDYSEIDLSLSGYIYARISIFDHWLSDKEAEVNKVMFYSLAVAEGMLDEYIEGEKKFLKLYRSLSESGVICKYPGPLRWLDAGNPELENVMVNSLRENGFMDAYFIAARARIVGGHDRTDLLILENEVDLEAVHIKVKAAGLFLLR